MAILCRVCGTRNADDATFCSNCTSFLEWEGERVPDEPQVQDAARGREAQEEVTEERTEEPALIAPPVEEPPTASEETPSIDDPIRDAAPPADQRVAERQAAAGEEQTPPAAGRTVQPDVVSQPVTRPPIADVPPSRRPTTPQRPGRPDARERAGARRPEAPRPGELICGNCGTGNDPQRRFCRRCGHSLATAPVAVRLPWYRRIFTRRARVTAAGTRPGRMGRRGHSRPLFSSLIVLLVLGGLVGGVATYLFVPAVQTRVNGAVGEMRLLLLPSFEEIHPQASGSGLPDHPGSLVADRNTLTYWAADTAIGSPELLVEFQEPTNLGKLIVHNGATQEEFLAYARPRTIVVRYAGGDEQELELRDTLEDEVFDLDARSVEQLTITVVDWYAAQPPTGTTTIALRELEFRARR